MSCLGFSTASRALKTFHPKYHSSKLVARHNIQLTCYSTSTTGMQYLKHNPPRSAPRQVPTPLVFLSSSSLDKLSTAGMRRFAIKFAQKGFTCLEIDLPQVTPASKTTGAGASVVMGRAASDLRSLLSSSTMPFPPVLISRTLSTLVAQTYVSSYPLQGLVLISPPPSIASLKDSQSQFPNLPNLFDMKEFKFEPKFPVLVIEESGAMSEKQIRENRIVKKKGADLTSVLKLDDDDEVAGKIDQWLDELGI